jgi:hypothetical protein
LFGLNGLVGEDRCVFTKPLSALLRENLTLVMFLFESY